MRSVLRVSLLVWVGLFWVYPSFAQSAGVSIGGRVLDQGDASAAVGATVKLQSVKDSTQIKYAIVDEEGYFLIRNIEQAFYRMTVTSLAYKPYSKIIRIGTTDMNLGKTLLVPDEKMLESVEIKGEVVPVEQKGDTVQYNADAYTVNKDASTKDLVSKMPGIVVDGSGVTANGETVEQVLLDGKRFFGQDPLLSLNTIPAEVVDKIEVFDQKSEQAQLTGYDDGNTTKTMNVVTKVDKRNGQFGNAYSGYGTDDRYKAGVNVNSFKEDARLTVLGMTNNINQQNFSEEDLAGLSGGSGRRRGSGSNLMTGTQNGVTDTEAVGVNFTDDWGEKATFEGSYFFNHTDNSRDEEQNKETFLENGSQYYTEAQESAAENYNHRLNTRITYNINKKNKLIALPALSYQNNESEAYTLGVSYIDTNNILNETENLYASNNEVLNFSNRLIFQHKFEKIGRSVSFELDTRATNTERDNLYHDLTTDSLTQYLTDESNYRIGGSVIYTEPVGNTAQLAASYTYDYQDRSSDRSTYEQLTHQSVAVFNPALSNALESGYTRHIPSIELSNRSYGSFYQFRLSYQLASLNNNQQYPQEQTLKKSFRSLLPSIMGRFDLNGGSNIFVRYHADTNEPSVDQLQNVADNSDPLFWSFGNADLDQSYTHSLMMRWSTANADKNTTLANFTRVQTTQDYITDLTYIAAQDSTLVNGLIVPRGAQVSQPTNLDGYWRVTNQTSMGWLVSAIKSNLNTSIGIGYTRQPGMTNGQANFSNTYTGSARITLGSNFSENVDFNIYYDLSANKVYNSIQEQSNSSYRTQLVGVKSSLTFWKGLVFRNDMVYEKYNGVNSAFDTQFLLWNMSVAKKFLRNQQAELELSVFDLLNQNRSVTQNVSASAITETRTEVLQQYFMLTFTYQIRRFKG